MKKPLNPTVAICLVVAAMVPAAFGQVRPASHVPKANYDKRVAAVQQPEALTQAHEALTHLKSQLSSAAVDFDELLGTPKFARSQDGFLTGPDGEGRAVSAKSLQSVSAADPDRAVK